MADSPVSRLGDRLERLIATGRLDVAVPGVGSTWQRWHALAAVATDDLSLARLAEGHLDAHAILVEASRDVRPGRYGVYAARGPDSAVGAVAVDGAWRLQGRRRYCSGARILDRALVDVDGPDGPILLDVDLRSDGIDVVEGSWNAVGMAATDSVTLAFRAVEVPLDQQVGAPGFYTDRAGFGHGGIGVAACWWGGAVGLARASVDHVARQPPGPRRRRLTAVGLLLADCESVLAAAAADLDADPLDVGRAQHRAAATRWSVNAVCWQVLGEATMVGGTHGATVDADQARRLADLPVYLTQFGGPLTLDVLDPHRVLPDPANHDPDRHRDEPAESRHAARRRRLAVDHDPSPGPRSRAGR